MEFRRIERFPPYVFSIVNDLKMQARREGEDIIDLGMGNPDIPTPEAVVEKLQEAAANPRNHRYSASRGIPKLRSAICDLYERGWGVTLDPDSEAVVTIGAKEGLSHLAWILAGPGDSVLVPEPTYPIHTYAMILAGANLTSVQLSLGSDIFTDLVTAYEHSEPKPRALLCSFPHNPTTAVVDLAFFEQLVEFARSRNIVIVHDLAYADLVFDAERAPSLMQVPGARDVGVEFFSMSKSYSMPGELPSPSATRRSSVRWRSSSPTSTTASSSPYRSPRSSPSMSATRFPNRYGRPTGAGATPCVTAWTGSDGK
jgi:alanine-synthesizing transaminase